MGGGSHHKNAEEADLYHDDRMDFVYPDDPADSVPEAGPSEPRRRAQHHGPSPSPPPPPPPFPGSHEGPRGPHDHHHRHHHSRGHHGPHDHPFGSRGGRGGWGGRGGGRGRGGWGGMGRPPFNQPFDMRDIASFIGDTFFGGNLPAGFPGAERNTTTTNSNNNNGSFTPEADVFDTTKAYIVHLSLPGAKKEDVAVTWNAEQNELVVSGVILRDGDEEFLNTLAMDERKVGAFERKIRLGSTAAPAQVVADHISAKLEDGVLRLNVPKQEKTNIEARKINIM